MLIREKQGRIAALGATRAERATWAVVSHPAAVRAALEQGLSNVSTGKAPVVIPETGLTGSPQAIAARETVKAMLAAIEIPPAPPVPGVPKKPAVAPPKPLLEKVSGALLPIGLALGFALLKG